MSLKNQVLGKSGEDIAALFFEERGYAVVERNWRCKAGEIDLIVRKSDEWRFVEVKTRTSERYGRPEESLTKSKQEHFRKAIQWYVLEKGMESCDVHADVFALVLNGKDFEPRWLPDAV